MWKCGSCLRSALCVKMQSCGKQQLLDRHLLAISIELFSILKAALHQGRACRLRLMFAFPLQALAVILGIVAAESNVCIPVLLD